MFFTLLHAHCALYIAHLDPYNMVYNVWLGLQLCNRLHPNVQTTQTTLIFFWLRAPICTTIACQYFKSSQGPTILLSTLRYRQRQIKELVKFVNKSDADFVLLGGDFNVDPKVKLRADQYWLFKLYIDQGSFDAIFLLLIVCWYLKRVAIKNKFMQVNANETTYQDVKNIMTNSIEEFFHKIEVKKKTHLNDGPSIFLHPSIFRTG